MPRVRVILQLGRASGCRIHMSYWWLHISSPLVSATLSCACSLPGVLLPQVLLLSSRQVVWVAAEEILCCGLAQLAMSCSLLQLHSPTLFPYPSFLSSSMAVDGPTAKAGGGGTSSAAASLIHVPSSTWLLWIVSVVCYRIPGVVYTTFTHFVQSGWSFCSSFLWWWRMKMICCVLHCTAWVSCILWDTYCGAPWSLQCHSDEHVAQTTWQFPYQFLWR